MQYAMRALDLVADTYIMLARHNCKLKTFTPFGVPGCKPEATLVPETGVAAAQHI